MEGETYEFLETDDDRIFSFDLYGSFSFGRDFHRKQ